MTRPLKVDDGDLQEVAIRLPRLMIGFLKKAARDSGEEVSDVVHDIVYDAMVRSFDNADLIDAETGQSPVVSEASRDRAVLDELGLSRMGSMSAEELRAIRARLKMTQAALAEQLKVDVMTVSRWERGKNGLRPRQAFRLRTLARKRLAKKGHQG